MNRSAMIRIQAVVEIDVDSWGADVSFNDIREQATREGLQKLENAIKEHRGRVIGQPKALLVTVMETP